MDRINGEATWTRRGRTLLGSESVNSGFVGPRQRTSRKLAYVWNVATRGTPPCPSPCFLVGTVPRCGDSSRWLVHAGFHAGRCADNGYSEKTRARTPKRFAAGFCGLARAGRSHHARAILFPRREKASGRGASRPDPEGAPPSGENGATRSTDEPIGKLANWETG